MRHRNALNQVFRLFDIKAKDVARVSGVRENQISRFRLGRTDLHAETLFRVVEALPNEAKAYFYALMMCDSESKDDETKSRQSPSELEDDV
jgi:transcriptional regulator with XRE-family HTH domain